MRILSVEQNDSFFAWRNKATNQAKSNIYELFFDAICTLHSVWNRHLPGRNIVSALDANQPTLELSDFKQQTCIIAHWAGNSFPLGQLGWTWVFPISLVQCLMTGSRSVKWRDGWTTHAPLSFRLVLACLRGVLWSSKRAGPKVQVLFMLLLESCLLTAYGQLRLKIQRKSL